MIGHFKCAANMAKALCVAVALFFGMAVSPDEAAAQGKTVSGVVTDAVGPVPGVGVFLKGDSTVGTSTDAEGKYTLSGLPADAVLVFNALGFAEVEEVVGNRTQINVTLSEDALMLAETVVIGYGTQRKGDVTSAVASVKPEDFTVGNLQDASDMIRGKVAGLSITKSSGDPNAGSTIRLRGTTTINGDLTPLILVDGVPGDMGTVAPENIADISVLKDASAAAIYGTRGANGVILITTKSGKRGENVSVTYSGYASLSTFANRADFYTADDIKNGYNGLEGNTLTSFKDMGFATDWLDLISRNGFSHNNSLSISGGTKSTTYSASVSYRGEQGVIINTDNNELKMTFDVSQYLFNDILKLNLNLVKGIHKNTDSDPTYAYRQALIRNPTAPVYALNDAGEQDPSLGYHEEFGRFQYFNPVSMINEATGDTQSEWTNLAGNITLEPVKGWKTNLMLATHRYNSMSEMYYSKYYYSLYSSWINAGDPAGYNGSASKSQANSISNYLDLTSQYDALWGKHRFSAMVGYSYTYNMWQGFSGWNSDFPAEFLYNSLGSGSNYITDEDGKLERYLAGVSSYKNDDKLVAFFGRISYGYDDRYNVMVSFRREGSSKFGANHKWGNFPSASASWNIHNEEFMANTKNWLSNFKLRLGWGVTGIIPGSSYASLVTYDYDTYNKYFNTSTGQWEKALMATQNPNPDLRWETSNEINLGIDMGFFADRLTFSLDLYNKNTNGLLYNYAVPLPPNLYNSILANVGVMNNKGVELFLTAVPVITKDFEWESTLAVSHNSNKLVSLSNDLYETADYLNTGGVSDPVSVTTHRVEVGMATGNFWGLKSVHGVTSDGKWIVELPDGTWTPYSTELNDDQYRQYLGTGVPQVNLSWGNTFSYKGFDLGIQLSSQLGFYILNNQRLFYQNNSIAYNRLSCASDALPIYDLETKEPTGEYTTLSTAQTQGFISEFLERGDYLKLDNVTLGYTFNTKNNKYVKSARLYLSGDNLAVLTGYSGLDPEIANGNPFWGAGIDDRDKYPTIRSFTFGVNLTF